MSAFGWPTSALFVSGVKGEEDQPCSQCWVPETPPDAEGCDEVGVVGAVTGMVAACMALETVKRITGAGDGLRSQIWLLDGLSGQSCLAYHSSCKFLQLWKYPSRPHRRYRDHKKQSRETIC